MLVSSGWTQAIVMEEKNSLS